MKQIKPNTKVGNRGFTRGGIQMWRHKSGATLKRGRPATSKLTLKDPIGKGSRQGGPG
jgi:hypothetical protein